MCVSSEGDQDRGDKNNTGDTVMSGTVGQWARWEKEDRGVSTGIPARCWNLTLIFGGPYLMMQVFALGGLNREPLDQGRS